MENTVTPKTIGEKVLEILLDKSLTHAGQCNKIAEVYRKREDEISIKLACLEMSDGQGIVKAKDMFNWVME